MEINHFINKMADLYEEVGIGEFGPDTKFKEFDEWSSLTALSIIAMCDDEYGVVIKGDEIRAISTVQELFDLVMSKA